MPAVFFFAGRKLKQNSNFQGSLKDQFTSTPSFTE